jgi:hypothetical protein
MPVNAGKISVAKFDEILPITNYSKRILFVGTKESSGTATNFELKENIRSLKNVETFYGKASHIAQGLKYAVLFNENRAAGEDSLFINAIGINPVGVKATATIAFSGTTATDTQTALFSAIKEYEKKTFTVNKGDTPAMVATTLNTVINNDTSLPFVSVVHSNTSLNLTATCEGSFLNYVKLLIENLPTGITAAITNFANGSYSGLSDLTNLKNAIINKKFDFVVIEKDLFEVDSSLKTFFDNRMNLIQNIDQQGLVLMSQVSENINSFVNNYSTNQFAIILAQYRTYTLPYILLAELACKIAGSLVRNYLVSDYMVSSDGLGGPVHANKAINEIKVDTVLKLEATFDNDNMEALFTRGFLTIENNQNNQFAIITGNISTYTVTNQGTVPALNRINDLIRKMIGTSLGFEAVKPFMNKMVKLGSKTNLDYDITTDEIIATCTNVITVLQYRDVNNVIYGYLQNNAAATLRAKAKIESVVNNNTFTGRTINLGMVQELAKTIENIILSIGFR